MHTSRCARAKTDKKTCQCGGCNGDLHGLKKNEGPLGAGEILLSEKMGGEIAEFINENKSKEYLCFSNHSKHESNIHIATDFYGVKTDGSGLKDGKGNIYWVFLICDAPSQQESPHQTSFNHLAGAIERAKIERDASVENFEDDI